MCSRRGADGETHADFVRALTGKVRSDTVQANDRKREREHAKRRDGDRADAHGEEAEAAPERLRHALYVVQRQVRLEVSNRSFDSRRERVGRYRRSYLEHPKSRVLLCNGDEEVGLRIFEEELILAGLRNPHHFDPVPVRPGRFEAPADRVLTGPQHVREALVDDRHPARPLVVGVLEAPPANDLNPHGLEVSGTDDVLSRGHAAVAVAPVGPRPRLRCSPGCSPSGS